MIKNMTKSMMKITTALSLTLLTSTTASAHTGIESSSLMHSIVHVASSVGIYIAIMLAGLYFFNRLPKAKKVRIKAKK